MDFDFPGKAAFVIDLSYKMSKFEVIVSNIRFLPIFSTPGQYHAKPGLT